MKIPIELFLHWQDKNMFTYYNTNANIEFYLLFYKNKLKQKTIICPHCKSKVIKTKGDKVYCSRKCQMRAGQLRYKTKIK